jgi:hypothetical protein
MASASSLEHATSAAAKRRRENVTSAAAKRRREAPARKCDQRRRGDIIGAEIITTPTAAADRVVSELGILGLRPDLSLRAAAAVLLE